MRRVICFACTVTVSVSSHCSSAGDQAVCWAHRSACSHVQQQHHVLARADCSDKASFSIKADLKLQALQHDFNSASNQPHPVHHCGLP